MVIWLQKKEQALSSLTWQHVPHMLRWFLLVSVLSQVLDTSSRQGMGCCCSCSKVGS